MGLLWLQVWHDAWHSDGGDTPAGAGESVNLRCINGEEILLITIGTK
jgi:hypothetical protein